MSPVTCVSRVTCHTYTCYMSHVIFFIFILFFSGQSGEAYRWRVYYQQGLPRLVFLMFSKLFLSFSSELSVQEGLVSPHGFNFIRATFQKFLDGRSWLFHHHKLSNCRQGTCNMISRFFPWPMMYSFLLSKHQKSYYAVCNKAPNTFDSTTCRPAARLKRWLLNWYPTIQRQRGKHCEPQVHRWTFVDCFRIKGGILNVTNEGGGGRMNRNLFA